MAENDGLDLSKIVGLIMENPKLIEEIAAMAKGSQQTSEETTSSPPAETRESVIAESATPTVTYAEPKPRSRRRGELLGAMKPYLSEERAKALDSVLTIADILDLMKER